MGETSEVLQISQEQAKNNFQNRVYEIEGNRIGVSYKEFSPTNKEVLQDEAIIFLPGWSAKNAETLDDLTQSFTNNAGKRGFLVTTRPEKVIAEDSLEKEAQAIRNMIVEEELKKVILAAHSQGGIKAVDLIYMLQKENQNIDISGLVLLDPVGLYEQGKMELASKFTLDALIKTPGTMLKYPSLITKGLKISTDIIFNIAKEMASSKVVGYPNKLWRQIGEMARANTHYQDVRCPVVLIQGEQDPVSSHDKIIPSGDDPKFLTERRKILKETFFPNSPQVDMLVPKKIGRHGIPNFRAESIANTSLGLLERYRRTQRSINQTPLASQGDALRS